MTLPLTGDLGNREKYKYAWVHSVQPPQPYIILEGGRETGEEEPLEIYRVSLCRCLRPVSSLSLSSSVCVCLSPLCVSQHPIT